MQAGSFKMRTSRTILQERKQALEAITHRVYEVMEQAIGSPSRHRETISISIVQRIQRRFSVAIVEEEMNPVSICIVTWLYKIIFTVVYNYPSDLNDKSELTMIIIQVGGGRFSMPIAITG